MNRHVVWIFLLMQVLWTGCDGERPEKTANPNIILILADDMGYGDPGAYNPSSKIPTPNIDRLAEEGMRFTDAHAPGAVCHPSRYGLLTGRYPFRTNTNIWPNQPVIDESRMTIASLLHGEGYRTAMVGKWHLGFDESHTTDPVSFEGNNTRAAFRQYDPDHPLTGGPVDRGFDSFFGIRASTDIPPYFYIRNDQIVRPPTDTIESNYSDGWTDIQGAFWRAGGIAPGLELENVLPRFIHETITVIEDHNRNNPEQPLLLYVALPSPHTPWLPADKYKNETGAGMYGDFVAMVDAKVGEILKSLDEQDMSQETLVVFSSDNGPVWYDEDVKRFGHDSQGGLRGMKGDAWEAGHRMPFIVRWPGVVEPGSDTHQTISFTDLLATFADITGSRLPKGAGEDSFSLLPVLTGDQSDDEPVRPPVVSISSQGVRAIQDGQWKLIESLGSGGFTNPVYIDPGPGDPKGQLYNLAEDPAETNNVWQEHPEVVERLQSQLQALDEKGNSHFLKRELTMQ